MSQQTHPQTALSLRHAVEIGDEAQVRNILKDPDADVNVRGQYGTVLTDACVNGHCNIVSLLIEDPRTDVNFQDYHPFKRTPLLSAIEFGNEEAAELLLRQDRVNPNLPDLLTKSPLNLAAAKGRRRIVKALLQRPDLEPNFEGAGKETPLKVATIAGHEEIICMLLEDERVQLQDPSDQILEDANLRRIVKRGLIRATHAWLHRRYGNDARKDSFSAAKVALEYYKEDVLECIIRLHGHHIPAEKLVNLLDYATTRRSSGMIIERMPREIFQHLINLPDENNRTPLIRACEKDRPEVVEVLLRHGADSSFEGGEFGKTGIQIARERRFKDVVEVFTNFMHTNGHQ